MKTNYFSMPNPEEMQSLIDFCKVMASSPFYAKLGPGGVMAIYLTAKEYDLPFMACMNGGLHTFDGKVTFAAIMIDALILKAGHKTKVLVSDEKRCVIEFTRGDRRHDKDYKPLIWEYTVEKAAKAGYLKKNNWQTSLQDMLYCRCLTGGGRKHMPEVFVGVMVTGELVGDDSDSDIAPLLPSNVAPTTNLLPSPANLVEDKPQIAQPLQISHEKSANWDQFCLKYAINEGTTCDRYLKEIVANDPKKRTYIQVVNSAIESEDKFAMAYSKWTKNEEKKAKELPPEAPRSMDEVQNLAEGIKELAKAVKASEM